MVGKLVSFDKTYFPMTLLQKVDGDRDSLILSKFKTINILQIFTLQKQKSINLYFTKNRTLQKSKLSHSTCDMHEYLYLKPLDR